MEFSWGALTDVPIDALLEVLNDQRIARHMPLWGRFDDAGVREWASAKSEGAQAWRPRAVWIDGRFAGWAGIQVEDYGLDVAIVLAPWAWGAGAAVATSVINTADEHRLGELFIALPPTRNADHVVAKLGFTRVADDVDGFALFKRAAPPPRP